MSQPLSACCPSGSNTTNNLTTDGAAKLLQQEIASEMQKAGHVVGTEKAAAEKLQQKFVNLQKKYMAFVQYTYTAGTTSSNKKFRTKMNITRQLKFTPNE